MALQYLSVDAVYTKALAEADKMGSDYFNLPRVLSFFKTATYDLIGKRIAEIELSQMVTDDIRPLVVKAAPAATADPDEQDCFLVAVPGNYLAKLRLNVQYTDQMLARQPNVVAHGDFNVAMIDPLNRPEKDYPLIVQMEDYFKIYCGPTANVANMTLIYVKHPTFGTENDTSQPMVNLPVPTVEAIIKMMVTDWLISKGDQRMQPSNQREKEFRKAN